MGTLDKSRTGNSFINLIIGFSLLAFALVLAWFVFKIIFGLAPLIGLVVAILGGIWYVQADNDADKLRAAKTIFGGLVTMVIFGMIF